MSASEGEKILIVDDDDRLRRLLERFLTEQGYAYNIIKEDDWLKKFSKPRK